MSFQPGSCDSDFISLLSALTQHCADLIGQDGVGVVQPASSAQALFEAVEDGLVGQQHHEDPQSHSHRA